MQSTEDDEKFAVLGMKKKSKLKLFCRRKMLLNSKESL